MWPGVAVCLRRAWFAGCDQAGFVGEDDGLGSVAEAELGQDAADVGLGGLHGDNQAAADFGVGHAARDQPEYLGFLLGQCVQRGRDRRVTDGASSASPAATTRTACTSAAAVASLSRKPLAPARNASYT